MSKLTLKQVDNINEREVFNTEYASAYAEV